jgi:hypothetical protein
MKLKPSGSGSPAILSAPQAQHVEPPPPMLPGRTWSPLPGVPPGRLQADGFAPDQKSTRTAPPPEFTRASLTATGPLAPLPAPTTEVVNGVTIENYGASPGAVAEAESIARREVTRPDLITAMATRKVTLVIIPADRKMTDLPEFASLRGQKTFDGRPWEGVRGSGGSSMLDGRIVIGVSEENLAHLPSDPYGGKYSVGLHELAHSLQNYALPKAERRAVTEAFDARKAAGGPWTEAYGSSNELEYFAQLTNAWFGVNTGIGHNGAAWVEANDPPMAAILQRLYGAPPAPPVPATPL